MKILLTSSGKDWDSMISPVFGRAEGYILYNEDNDHISWFSNEKNRNAGHGAGIQAGQDVAGLGAQVLITGGDVGPKALEVLRKAGIEIYSGVGDKTVKEAFEAYMSGVLNDE